MYIKKGSEYYEGLREGLRRAASLKDGKLYIGNKLLDQVIRESYAEEFKFRVIK